MINLSGTRSFATIGIFAINRIIRIINRVNGIFVINRLNSVVMENKHSYGATTFFT